MTTHFSTKLGTCLDKLGGIGHESEFLEEVKVLGEQGRRFNAHASTAPAVAPATRE